MAGDHFLEGNAYPVDKTGLALALFYLDLFRHDGVVEYDIGTILLPLILHNQNL